MIFVRPALRSACEGVVELARRVVGEAGHPDVADRAAGEVLVDDLLAGR